MGISWPSSHGCYKHIIYFNWRTIPLQYCGGFCHTPTWINIGIRVSSASWDPLPPSSPLSPSKLSQSTGFGCPASCTKLTPVICFTYGNVYVSVLFSTWEYLVQCLTHSSADKESACRRHRIREFSHWVRKIPWRRKWQHPLRYSCLENPMDRRARRATVQRVTSRHDWTWARF